MEFVTSDRDAIGNYKRCAYEYEAMDNVLKKIEKRAPFQNHHKLLDLQSYTKHYDRFQKDLAILKKFKPEQLQKEFESSKDMDGRTGKWRENLRDWAMPNFPPTPAMIRSDYDIP